MKGAVITLSKQDIWCATVAFLKGFFIALVPDTQEAAKDNSPWTEWLQLFARLTTPREQIPGVRHSQVAAVKKQAFQVWKITKAGTTWIYLYTSSIVFRTVFLYFVDIFFLIAVRYLQKNPQLYAKHFTSPCWKHFIIYSGVFIKPAAETAISTHDRFK